MQGIYLKFYVQENRRHHGILAYEWLLEEARKLGLHGGSAFRAIAGFGRQLSGASVRKPKKKMAGMTVILQVDGLHCRCAVRQLRRIPALT